ncbi:hypothetical protein [Methylosinus sp. R-45379]|uniref:hypothetical protein n=1 Tax=Methylosinus sp. R-45379 TaxID=980563 RepID=UPI001FD96197|nr:hypothetical protein [Methylosinus sp. R-45379]
MPTDLLGITPAIFEPDRQDGNMVAALGAACNRVRKAVQRIGEVPRAAGSKTAEISKDDEALIDDPNDCMSVIQSWMGGRSFSANTSAIKFTDVDRELKLAPGSARNYIAKAAAHWGYSVGRSGKDFIMFEKYSEF